MSDIFISHASADKTLALRLSDALLAKGYGSVFLDVDPERGIAPFAEWEQVLYRKLRACRAVIALCTDSFVASKWCFAEVSIARSLERAVLPVVSTSFTGDVSALPSTLSRRQVIVAGADDAALGTALAKGLREFGVDPSPWEPWDPQRSPIRGLPAMTHPRRRYSSDGKRRSSAACRCCAGPAPWLPAASSASSAAPGRVSRP